MKLVFIARKSRANSVQADWIGSLPELKMQAFRSYARDLESLYLMLSAPLDEAIGSRKRGLREESIKHVLIVPGLVTHFMKHLDGILRAMQQHAKNRRTEPSVAPLNPANFLSPDGIKGARRSQLISRVLISKRTRYIEKIRSLRQMMTHIENGFRGAAEGLIPAGAASESASLCAALDALHYDLNTCLRETMVLLKCFMRAIPEPELAEFQKSAATMLSRSRSRTQRHEILFCSGETALLNGLTCFIADALVRGNPAVVWATESHRDKLRQELRRGGVDVDAAIREGLYLASDVSEPPDAGRIIASLTGLREAAIRAGNQHPHVAACGERAGRIWAEGQTDVALHLEQCLNQLAKTHDLDILCVYPVPISQLDENAVKTICGEHSVVSFE